MKVHKYTSCAEVINKVYRDTGIQYQINQEDLIQWIYEVLGLLGTTVNLIPKMKSPNDDDSYNFENHRVELPCDFYKLRAISVNGWSITPSTYGFHNFIDDTCALNSSTGLEIFTDNFGNTYGTVAGPLGGNPSTTFEINNNYITFNSRSGSCYIAYWAFPIDKNGLPLVPDEVKVLEAITRYLIMKLDYIGWRTNQISRDLYEDSKREYEWYIGSASNHLKFPDEGQMENLKNQMIKLKPNHQQYQDFFGSISNNPSHRN